MHDSFKDMSKEAPHEPPSAGVGKGPAKKTGSVVTLPKSEVPSTHDEDDEETADREALKPIPIEDLIAEVKAKGYHKHKVHKGAPTSL